MAYIEITDAMVAAAARVLFGQHMGPNTLRVVKDALRAAFEAGTIQSEPLTAAPETHVFVNLTGVMGTETIRVEIDGPEPTKHGAVVDSFYVTRRDW